MYPKNTWYVACTPDEIAQGPLGRQICGEKIVFYRSQENQVAAVEDFCPHRGAPLSLGYVENGNLVCGYHGLVMGCDGKTVEMPGQRVRGFPCNKTFAVVERYGFIWVWPGEQDKADPTLIHHLEWAVSDQWAYGGGLFHIGCDYRLMIDNLMDLTHETYVHASSIGQKEIDEAAPTTTVEGDEVVTARHMENIMAPPFWRMALRGNNLADDVPETETSIWYFWGMARNFNPQDEALTATIREGQGKIFSEDLEMLERQQQNLLDHPQRNVLKLNIDAGGVQSRRVLERIIASERAPEPQLIATAQ